MIRYGYLLWFIIAALALLIVAQVVGQGILDYWEAKSDRPLQPNPSAVRQSSDR